MKSDIFSSVRIAAILAVILQVLLTPQAVAARPSTTDASVTMSVVVEGSVPGFTQDQLSDYISRQMTEAHVASWQFAPAGGNTTSPNRVVWQFKLLPYAGGAVRYIGPAVSRAKDLFGIRRSITIDAELYFGGKVQTKTFDQATVKGGAKDPDLAAAIQKIVKAIITDAVT